jgi:transcription antitermination factor NusG
VHIAPIETDRVIGIRGAVNLVGFGSKPSSIPNEQIATIQAALSARASIPVPYFPANTPVRILSGPLTGLEGTVVRDKGKSRMIVSLHMIMRSVSVELDPLDLERLE